MGLRRVDTVPTKNSEYNQLDKDLEEFCTSCIGCAELTGYDKPAKYLLTAVRYRIGQNGYPCKPVKRGESAYLVRDYGKSEAWRRNHGEGHDAA